MSNAFKARFDAIAARAFKPAGLCDDAMFKLTPASTAVECTVLIDRNVQFFGNDSQVTNPETVLTSFMAETVVRPQRGSTFTVGAETFTVDKLQDDKDESRTVCIVRVS